MWEVIWLDKKQKHPTERNNLLNNNNQLKDVTGDLICIVTEKVN